jgi:hypothetical protein
MRALSQVLSLAIAFALPASSLAQGQQSPAQAGPHDSCPPKSLLLDFDVYRFGQHMGQTPIWQLGKGPAFYFTSGMMIDADGAPNAYNADDTGLDDLFNAGQPGHWDGIIQDEDGNPVIQGPDDPFPGYYISCTALFDRTKHHFDPARFVDSTRIPYIALPGDLAEQSGARLGDLLLVFSERTGKYSYAIFADIGVLGEGSIALAENLGIWSDAREGGSRGGVSYLVFPGSGDGQPKTVEEINERGSALLEAWGGAEKVRLCGTLAADRIEALLDRDQSLKIETLPAKRNPFLGQ